MRYSFRQLEVFLATAKHENVTRAADSLAMSQSAASGALKELEAQFNVQLFDRIGKRLKLSEFGTQLRPEAQNLLARALDFERAIGGADVMGKLHIGATMTIGNYLAVGMIADFRHQYPAAQVELSVANTHAIAARVVDFELDMGLIEGEYYHRDLTAVPWRPDELQVFVAPQHPLANGSVSDDVDLLNIKWILRESGSGTRQAFNRAMQGILPELKVDMELQRTEAIKRAVEANLGVGCLSSISLVEAFARGSLCPVAVPHRDFSRQLYIITHRSKFQNEALKQWLQLCIRS